MARWQRVHTPRSFFQMMVASAAVPVLFMVVFLFEAVRNPWTILVVGAFLLTMFVYLIRVGLMSVFYNDLGVRSRSLLRTWTVPWDMVAKFEDRPAVSNPWVPGGGLPARAIWIVLRGGEAIQTPVVYEPVPFLEDPGNRPQKNRWKWSREECQVVFTQLNRLLDEARRAAP